MSTNSKEYAREYYKKNRLKINKQRQRRYQNDPEYAQRKRDYNREYSKKYRPKEKPRYPPGLRHYQIEVKDKLIDVLMYEIGALGTALDRRAQTIRLWEKQEVLPEALYRTKTNRRLYTEDQVCALVEAHNEVMKKAKGMKWLTKLKSAFSMAWKKLLPYGVKKERYQDEKSKGKPTN